MIRIIIPFLLVLIALRLYFKRPAWYVAFTLWVYFLAPLVRRLVDWQFGWVEPNFILLAPLLVAAVGAISFIAPTPARKGQLSPAVWLCLAAVLYGFLVGMVRHPSAETVFGLANWLTPLLFGAHLAADWRSYEDNRKAVLNTFVWGAAVMGTYGLYQFFVAPPWDAFWLQNVGSGLVDPSFGQPEPMMMRTWSTLNAPGPFAGTMMVALIMLIIARSKWKLPIAVVGYSSFLLSSVRAAWLGFALALVLLFRKLNPKVLLKVVLSLVVLVVLLIPVLSVLSTYAPGLADRANSLKDLGQDASLQERQGMYTAVTGIILHEPFGTGLQNQTVAAGYPIDSGIMATLLSLGWLGTLMYLGGVVLLFVQNRRTGEGDLFPIACQSVCFSALAQYFGANIFVGLGGAIFWICASSCVAASRWAMAEEEKKAEEAKIMLAPTIEAHPQPHLVPVLSTLSIS